jgi:hypothetical protein
MAKVSALVLVLYIPSFIPSFCLDSHSLSLPVNRSLESSPSLSLFYVFPPLSPFFLLHTYPLAACLLTNILPCLFSLNARR